MAIAIIGAGGFVGSRLVESLVLEGRSDVRAVVRTHRNCASLSRFGELVSVHLANAENAPALGAALRGAQVVVNLTTGSPASIARTTEAIFEACALAKVNRLVHLSSAVVYGDVSSPTTDDDAPPVAKHWMPYARAKAAAERWLRFRQPMAPFQLVVLRPGIVWGVRSPHTLHIVNLLAAKSAYLVDDGEGIVNSIYIDNLCACIRTICSERSDATGFYNVGDEEVVTWRQFYSAFADALHYDMNHIPLVSSRRFPWSLSAFIDYVHSLPVVNRLYYFAKARLPDTMKAKVKAILAGRVVYDIVARHYNRQPRVERELWHLQRVRHKLPISKFARRFGFTPPVTFEEGVRRTLSWLEFLGYVPSQDAVSAGGIV